MFDTAMPASISGLMTECFTGGFVQTNGYLIHGTGDRHLLVDAPEGIAEWLAARGITPEALLLTHQHYDHVQDAALLASRGVPVYAWSSWSRDLTLEDLLASMGMPVQVAPCRVDHLLEGSSELDLAGMEISLLHVPGHSPDSVAFFFPGRSELFSGDTLMAGGMGRADLPGGNLPLLVSGIRGKILSLPSGTRVFSGHGPATTIGAEQAGNPYFRS